jgi:hypothetical protein
VLQPFVCCRWLLGFVNANDGSVKAAIACRSYRFLTHPLVRALGAPRRSIMPSFSELAPYLLVAALPIGLLGLYALFRWRYVQAVEQTIHEPPESAVEEHVAPAAPRRSPVSPTLHWHEITDSDARVTSAPLVEALSRTRSMRAALTIAGIAYLVTSFAVIWQARVARGEAVRVGFFIAWTMSFLPFFLILVFARLRWTVWVTAIVARMLVEYLLLIGLGASSPRAISLIVSGLDNVSLGVTCLALLVLRAIRPLLVGFVPLVLLLLVGALAMSGVILALGVQVEGNVTVRAVVGGLAASALGIAAAVIGIRRGKELFVVGILTVCLLLGVIASWYDLGLLLGALAGVGVHGLMTAGLWRLLKYFRHLKSRGHLPDEILHAGICWLVLSVLMTPVALAHSRLWPVLVLPYAIYLTTLVGILVRQRRTRPVKAPKRMLLLRVFNQARVRGRLLDVLDDSWRRVGRIDLVVGSDLAIRTLSPLVFEEFLLGRVHRQFLKNSADVLLRLPNLPNDVALDGRYPLNEIHSLPSVWQQVVSELAAATDVVMMDLRGFQATNRGAVFELSLIVSRVPLSHVVLLTDRTTDERLLTDVVQRSWSQVPEESPNFALVEPTIAVVRRSKRRGPGVTAMLQALFVAAFDIPAQSAVSELRVSMPERSGEDTPEATSLQ